MLDHVDDSDIIDLKSGEKMEVTKKNSLTEPNPLFIA